LSGGQA
jgi:molybdate transport system ATP-binding protein